jgi:hypothetical protein
MIDCPKNRGHILRLASGALMNEQSIVLVQDGTFITIERISDSGDAAI